MLAAVKLMCSHFLFNLDNAKHVVFGVEESQREVYLPTNEAPIYEGPDFTEINMPWLLHNFNFFRHHMLDEDAATLFGSIDALSTSQKPSAWRQPLQNGTYKLSKALEGYIFIPGSARNQEDPKNGPRKCGTRVFHRQEYRRWQDTG